MTMKRWGGLAALVLAVGSAAGAAAQDVTAIRAGRLIDVARGEMRRDQLIIVRGERIESVQPGATRIPAGARVMDLSRHTVLPGLIDSHAHLIGEVGLADVLLPLQRSGAQEAFSGVRNARATLLAGFTTVRDIGTYRAFVDAALREAIEDGTVFGPRMAVAGAYITVTTGAGELVGAANDVTVPAEFRFGVANSVEQVRERVRALLNGGADFIKILATGAVLTRGTKPGVSEYTEAELRAAVEQAAEYGAFVAAHAHGAEGIKRAVRAGVRSIEHGSLMDDEAIALMRERGTWLVADIYNGDYIATVGREQKWPEEFLRKNDETTAAQRVGFRKAVAAGVKIAYGTDSGVYPHGLNARQLPYMVRYGMTPMQAIQSATISAAQLMGWDDRIGSLTPGKYADIIAIEGDALADLARFEKVPFVMKGGVVHKEP
ncbi:MAG: amidohydrolase family protein [Gemmatimonadales bacterium]|nr:amidohydrolase family protein [Gemmatimonadales bacterium]MBA3554119.1 amidohydrolase family protein [Gemmatimonadales bacterium]